jgi:hypothetical protein
MSSLVMSADGKLIGGDALGGAPRKAAPPQAASGVGMRAPPACLILSAPCLSTVFLPVYLPDADTSKRLRVAEYHSGDQLMPQPEPILGYHYQAGHLKVYVAGTRPPAMCSALGEGATEAEGAARGHGALVRPTRQRGSFAGVRSS